ncbi:hypothetical protein TWF788_000765 [Orbilia oligospora]|uniref:Uncharacterized protein n=1 Tax=Orbilia oligospora TaxID=2813651 RepID=A0A7C8PMM3_ORBOL|nr:hypothetical protein TWF788_000765 [Orbilia oligospora]
MAKATVAATGSYLNPDLLVLGVALSSSGVSPEKCSARVKRLVQKTHQRPSRHQPFTNLFHHDHHNHHHHHHHHHHWYRTIALVCISDYETLFTYATSGIFGRKSKNGCGTKVLPNAPPLINYCIEKRAQEYRNALTRYDAAFILRTKGFSVTNVIVRSYSNGMPKPLVSPTAEVIYRVEDKPPNQTWIGTLIQSVLMLRLITARLGYNLSLRIAE